jgi:ParB family chromosome partitioning protein
VKQKKLEASMALLLEGLDLLASGGLPENGAPLRLPIAAINEDPDQPRQEFDDESLAELAETIKDRGIRQPVSVRTHPSEPGRWMLNFGARRLRASKLAGLPEIPAFVDHTANSVDQFIENEQRKGLTPLEIALFVQRSLNRGQSQAEIARAIGKSRQYVMIATALIDAPEWLMTAYRQGRCRGLNELHELRKLHAVHPEQVEAWAADNQSFTRDRVALLRTQLQQRVTAPVQPPAVTDPGESAATATMTPIRADYAAVQPGVTIGVTKAPHLLAQLNGGLVVVVTNAIPEEEGYVYIQTPKASSRQAVQASRLALIGFGVC